MPDLYAVIGNPIRQSKSPFIHTAFAGQAGHDIHYRAIEGSTGGFADAVDAFRAGGALGLNVTAPFKIDAFDYATVTHERARQAGAANCLKFENDRVEADNFDGIGLVRDLRANLGAPIGGKRVLILGAGGATRGALAPLLAETPRALVVANRTVAKAIALADTYSGTEAHALAAVDRLEPFDLVINATSAGLHGEAFNLPASVFAPGAVAYDMTYGKGLTAFLASARSAGVTRLHDGVGMLVEQAAEAFAWWRGIRPQTGKVIEELTVPLS